VCGEAGARGGRLIRIDPTSNRVVATIRLVSSTADPGGDIVVTNHHRIAGTSLEWLATLSDGIFAVS
jgi:hypothetical protein